MSATNAKDIIESELAAGDALLQPSASPFSSRRST